MLLLDNPTSSLIGSALQAVSSIIGTSVGAATQKKLQKRQNEFNYKMWQENNEYNKPVNQMSRMLAAGINPNAAAMGISDSNYSSSPVVGTDIAASQGELVSRGIESLGATLGDVPLKAAQVRNLNADSQGKEIDNETRPEFNQATIDKILKGIEIDNYTASILRDDASVRSAVNSANLAILQGTADKVKKEYDLLLVDIRSKEQEIQESIAREKKALSDIEVNKQDINESKSRVRLNELEKQLKALEVRRENLRTEAYERTGVDSALQPLVSAYLDTHDKASFLQGLHDFNYASESARVRSENEKIPEGPFGSWKPLRQFANWIKNAANGNRNWSLVPNQ